MMMKYGRSESGFTLIEVIVAMTIMAVIAGLLAGSLASVAASVSAAGDSQDVYQSGRVFLDRLSSDIRSATLVRGGDSQGYIIGEKKEVSGVRFDRLSLTAFSHKPWSSAGPLSESCETGYGVTAEKIDASQMRGKGQTVSTPRHIDEALGLDYAEITEDDGSEKKTAVGYLYRREDPVLDAEPDSGGDYLEISQRAVSLKISYYTGGKAVDEWDSRNMNNPPDAVGAELELADKDGRVRRFTAYIPWD